MLLPIDIKFAAIKVHFLQNKGPKFEPVGNFTVHLPCVPCFEKYKPVGNFFQAGRQDVAMAGSFLTQATEKTLKPKTQRKNSTSERHFPPLKKHLDFTNFPPKTETFSLGATFYATFMSKYFKIIPISTIYYQKY